MCVCVCVCVCVGGGGVNAFYWRQIYTLDSVVVNTQKMFSWHGGFITNAMHLPSSQRNNQIKLTHNDETKKRAHDSQIVRAKEYLKAMHGISETLVSSLSLMFISGFYYTCTSNRG